MISNIKIENFKSIRKAEIEFTNGLVVIKGPNAVGKSSLIQAMKFALYGATAVAGGRNIIPTYGKKDCLVELTLASGHIVTRTLKDCEITLDGRQVASGNKPCVEFITDLIGLDMKGFSVFHLSDQGETAALLTLGATELQRRVEKFSGIDVLDSSIKSARSDLTFMAGQMEGKSLVDLEPIQADLASKEADEKLSSDVVVTAGAGLALAKEARQTSRDDLHAGQAHNRKAEKNLLEKKKLQSFLDLYEQELSEKLTSLDAAKAKVTVSPDYVQDKIQKVQEVLQNGLTHNQRRADAKEALVFALEDLESSKARVKAFIQNQADREDLAKELAEAEALYIPLHDRHLTQAEAVARLSAQRDAITEAVKEAICPTCKRPFEGHDVKQLDDEWRDLTDEWSLATKELEVIRSDMVHSKSVLNSIVDRVRSLDAIPDPAPELARMEASVEKSRAVAEGPMAAVADTRVHLTDLQEQWSEAAATADKVRRLGKQTGKLSGDIADAKKGLKALPSLAPVNIQGLEAAVDVAVDSLVIAKDNLMEAKAAHITSQQAVMTQQQVLIEAEDANKVVTRLSTDLHYTKELVAYLVSSRERFLNTVWDTILHNAAAFCKVATKNWLGPDGTPKTIDTVARKDGAFSFSENGVMQPISGASGAQRAFIGVGIRLGMSIALRGTHSLLVLDEPTSDMSDENANALAGALLCLPGQVLMVTHRAHEQLSANTVIDMGELAT